MPMRRKEFVAVPSRITAISSNKKAASRRLKLKLKSPAARGAQVARAFSGRPLSRGVNRSGCVTGHLVEYQGPPLIRAVTDSETVRRATAIFASEQGAEKLTSGHLRDG